MYVTLDVKRFQFPLCNAPCFYILIYWFLCYVLYFSCFLSVIYLHLVYQFSYFLFYFVELPPCALCCVHLHFYFTPGLQFLIATPDLCLLSPLSVYILQVFFDLCLVIVFVMFSWCSVRVFICVLTCPQFKS